MPGAIHQQSWAGTQESCLPSPTLPLTAKSSCCLWSQPREPHENLWRPPWFCRTPSSLRARPQDSCLLGPGSHAFFSPLSAGGEGGRPQRAFVRPWVRGGGGDTRAPCPPLTPPFAAPTSPSPALLPSPGHFRSVAVTEAGSLAGDVGLGALRGGKARRAAQQPSAV